MVMENLIEKHLKRCKSYTHQERTDKNMQIVFFYSQFLEAEYR